MCVGGISIPGLFSGLAMLCCLISPMAMIDLGSQGILTRLPRIACLVWLILWALPDTTGSG